MAAIQTYTPIKIILINDQYPSHAHPLLNLKTHEIK